jgi:hypothetical protein
MHGVKGPVPRPEEHQPIVNQHQPAHHPLGAHYNYDSVVDELTSGSTLVTFSAEKNLRILVSMRYLSTMHDG